MLQYAQKMEFEEEPDYEYIENLLLLIKEKHNFSDTCEWQPNHNLFPQETPQSMKCISQEISETISKKKKRTRLGKKAKGPS